MSLSRKLSTDVALVGVMNVARMARSFVLIPIIVGAVGVGAYGAYAQVIALTSVLTFVFSLGLEGSLVRYAQGETVDTSTLYLSHVLPALITGTIAAIGVFVLARQISSLTLSTATFEAVFLSGAFLIPVRIMFKIARSYYRSEMRTKFAAALVAGRDYAGVAGVVGALYLYQTDIGGAVAALVGVEVVITLLMQLVVLRQVGLSLPEFGVMERSLRYALPLAGANLSSNVSTRADRLIVGGILGSEAVGVYDIAYRLASVVMAYSQPVITAFFPEFSRLLEEGKSETCGRYVRNGVRYFTILTIPSIFGLVLVNEQLVGLIAEPETAARTEILMPVLAAGIAFWGLDRLYGVLLVASENTSILLAVRGTAAALNVVLNLLLVPVFGLFGAAATTFGTYLLSSTLMYRYSNRIARSGMDLGTVARAMVAAAVMYVAVAFAVPDQLPAVLLVAPAIYFGVMALSGGIRESDIRTIRSWL